MTLAGGTMAATLEVVEVVEVDRPAIRRRGLSAVDRSGIMAIAAAKLAFHLATAGMYGLHRDEFYFLAAGRHPAAGYVDQPPIVPLLYRLWSTLFGSSTFSLHSLAAILSVPMVVL